MSQPPPDADHQPGETSLEGTEPPFQSPDQRRAALDQALDYRGDVTLHTGDGQAHEGYVFDIRRQADPPAVRLMLKAGGRLTVNEPDITRLVFSGRDTAAGKSWETWVKKYAREKLGKNLPADDDAARGEDA